MDRYSLPLQTSSNNPDLGLGIPALLHGGSPFRIRQTFPLSIAWDGETQQIQT